MSGPSGIHPVSGQAPGSKSRPSRILVVEDMPALQAHVAETLT